MVRATSDDLIREGDVVHDGDIRFCHGLDTVVEIDHSWWDESRGYTCYRGRCVYTGQEIDMPYYWVGRKVAEMEVVARSIVNHDD